MDINGTRDSFIIKRELNREACERLSAMKSNIFKKKTTLQMVTLENSIPSPWKEGKLVLKSDNNNVLQYEEKKVV